MTNPKPPLVAIGVATYKRPVGLSNLIASLHSLSHTDFELILIVVDNDPQESGRTAFEESRAMLPFPSRYVAEPSRGLSSVRNRIVAEARADAADYLAFVDDDETVHPMWIERHLETLGITGAVAVGGPQVYQFPPEAPLYIRRCFNPVYFKISDKISSVSTGNSLFSMSALAELNGPFDPRLNFSGGEDRMLSFELVREGGALAWQNDAITYEHVPAGRVNTRWVLKRRFRTGASHSQVTRLLHNRAESMRKHLPHGLRTILYGIFTALKSVKDDRENVLYFLAIAGFGMGEVLGSFTDRATLTEYRKPQVQ